MSLNFTFFSEKRIFYYVFCVFRNVFNHKIWIHVFWRILFWTPIRRIFSRKSHVYLTHGWYRLWKTWKNQGKKFSLENSGKTQGKMVLLWKNEILSPTWQNYQKLLQIRSISKIFRLRRAITVLLLYNFELVTLFY